MPILQILRVVIAQTPYSTHFMIYFLMNTYIKMNAMQAIILNVTLLVFIMRTKLYKNGDFDMSDEIIRFLLNNSFSEEFAETDDVYIRLFKMCSNCGNSWSLAIYTNGDWVIENEFLQPCWKNGYVVHQGNKTKIGNVPWVGKEVPEKVSTIEDAETLIRFVESYRHG